MDYLLKEVWFSTCDNSFFGELEKEMLVPNNVNFHGRLSRASNLDEYWVHLQFPRETAIAYVKEPDTSKIEGNSRSLSYRLGDLINFDDYWWHPLQGDTDFSIRLNLLPPFPNLNPVDLQIACRPDIAIGLDTRVTTHVRLEAEEQIDSLFIRHSIPRLVSPGVSAAIAKLSIDDIEGPRQTVTIPKEKYPLQTLSLAPGQTKEYTVETRITANPKNMAHLKCQQDLLTTKLVALTNTTPDGSPFGVSITGGDGEEMPIRKTVRSTILQATAQVMHSPFSLRQEPSQAPPHIVVQTPA